MNPDHPLRLIVIHRGPLPSRTPNPWSGPPTSRVFPLARAIATSPGWRDHGPATIVVRDGSEPVIAVVGRFDEVSESWLQGATQQLRRTLLHLVLLDERAVEEACRRLASSLLDVHGATNLRRFRFTAVPRGGLIVLGLLGYLLGIPRERMLPPAIARDIGDDGDEVPLVVVDDVAISGLRLSQFVAACPEPRLVIATLHAPPALRTAFAERHPAVESFVSAYDLRDLAPGTMGADYPAWLERWRSRVNRDAIWIGQPEHVVYPWNEPDVGVWIPAAEREEAGWHVVPPELCLKRIGEPAIDVQLMPSPTRGVRPSPEVVFGEHDAHVVIGHLGTGASYALDRVGTDMWRALVATGDIDVASERLASSYEAPLGQVRADMESFVAELALVDLLVQPAV